MVEAGERLEFWSLLSPEPSLYSSTIMLELYWCEPTLCPSPSLYGVKQHKLRELGTCIYSADRAGGLSLGWMSGQCCPDK